MVPILPGSKALGSAKMPNLILGDIAEHDMYGGSESVRFIQAHEKIRCARVCGDSAWLCLGISDSEMAPDDVSKKASAPPRRQLSLPPASSIDGRYTNLLVTAATTTKQTRYCYVFHVKNQDRTHATHLAIGIES
jgi:hypothetical protein